MARNVTMTVIGVLSLGALLTASLGLYRIFSFVTATLILSVIAATTIERNDRDPDLAPYTKLIGGLATYFFVGLAGIWLTWEPGVTEYSYVLGVPLPTLLFFTFIWLLPMTGTIYYALIFDRITDEDIVEDIVDSARERQREQAFPLAPEQPTEAPKGTEVTDGGVE